MNTIRLTVAQALIKFLEHQYIELDGERQAMFAGCMGIMGHGNVAGIGQALSGSDFPFIPFRNEQSMVHAAVGYTRAKNRQSIYACTSSIGPGATNMVTGAALATINRLPVLLLPGDYFAQRDLGPLLQELEHPVDQDISVNDCFRPVSRYWERIMDPAQLIPTLREACRVLASPSDTGAVTVALPHDVQTIAHDFDSASFEENVWSIERKEALKEEIVTIVDKIKSANRPLIIAGGGVRYSEAEEVLVDFVNEYKIPVVTTINGKGTISSDHPMNLDGVGVIGNEAANAIARKADLIISIGSRLNDFVTGSKSLFENPSVKFININVNAQDAAKMNGIPIISDAKACLQHLRTAMSNYQINRHYLQEIHSAKAKWAEKKKSIYHHADQAKGLNQIKVLKYLKQELSQEDIIVNASGSLPGELHQLWESQQSQNCHIEYGYSCMGYEIAGGLGAKMALRNNDVYVLVGDGGYLMMSQEIVTCIQEDIKLIILLFDNSGYKSIGGLAESIGVPDIGTNHSDRLHNIIAIDYAQNAASLGALSHTVTDEKEFLNALATAKKAEKTTLIHIKINEKVDLENYCWWDVPVAEVPHNETQAKALKRYREAKVLQRTNYQHS